MLIINFEGRGVKGLSKGKYDETFAVEDGVKPDYSLFLLRFPTILLPRSINRRCKHEHYVTRNSGYKGLSAFKTYINIGISN